jgi:hypothetical protein
MIYEWARYGMFFQMVEAPNRLLFYQRFCRAGATAKWEEVVWMATSGFDGMAGNECQ